MRLNGAPWRPVVIGKGRAISVCPAERIGKSYDRSFKKNFLMIPVKKTNQTSGAHSAMHLD